MEELVINAISTEDTQNSENSTSSLIWPFSNLGWDGSNRNKSSPEKAKTPKDASKRKLSLGRKSKPSSANHNAVPLVDEKFAHNRFQHDVEQAKMMRRGMEKRKQQKEQQRNKSNNEPTEANVRMAIEGLDEAVVLKRMGRTKDALEMSQLSIELLIGYLKSDPNTLNFQGLSRDAVGLRIQTALTLAEEMKTELNRKEQPVTTNNNTRQQHVLKLQEQHSAVESLSNMPNAVISKPDALSSRKVESITRTATNNNYTSSSSRKSSHSTASKTHNTTRNKPASYQGAAAAGPSPFANSQDPLVNTIKTELYIDPSKLHNTTWNDIAGLNDAKQALQEAAILPLMRPDLFSGLRRPRNILLYGPPGTGKTLLVKAVAHESSCVLFVCTASAMTSKWHGEGEKLLRTLFQVARAAAPSIVFVDEVDSLLSARKSEGEHEASRRFKTEFMTNMDGIVKNGGDENGKHLLVIAATNCPWDIDSAVLRRFPRRIYVPLPDSTTRKALLTNLLEKAGDTDLSKSDVKEVVKRLDGFSGSDIASIASEASFGPIRSLGGIDAIQAAKSSDIRPIQKQDFDKAIEHATKSVSKSLLKQYDQWKQDQAAS